MSSFFSPAVKEKDLIDLKSGLENLLNKFCIRTTRGS